MSTFTTLPRPTTVKPNRNYTLDLTFANGEERVFDVIPYLEYPAFQALKSVNLFMQARVEHHTVVWNEEIDMAPENLYLESSPLPQATL
jgi:Protein of unknown function (DUF2442)